MTKKSMLQKNLIDKIYNDYSKELLVYIFRLIGSKETSEDILHDCFVNLIKYSQRHEIKEKNLRAFLYKTAHNLSVNFIRRKKNIEFSSIESSGDLPDKNKIIKDIEFDELQLKITELLLNVEDVSRSIFIMRKELDMSIQEISENTGKSERTIRRRLKKTIDYLSQELIKSGFITFILIFMTSFQLLIVI
ncbi:MAG: sigma-70 family RNA polymerase sigma factor [Spirochaetota bacterium]|nr:sigma-70 family RNA polymerase sigma factor [Spirochaetota bacterium]